MKSPKGFCGMQSLQTCIAFRYSVRYNLLSLFVEIFTGAVPVNDCCCFSAVYMLKSGSICTIQVHTLSERANQEPRQLIDSLVDAVFFPQSIIIIACFKSAQTD